MDFIDCENCKDWSNQDKFDLSCPICKGKGIIRDPDSILCNNCGGKMCPAKPDMNWYLPNGLDNITVIGDYSSTHLLDCTKYTFSLCEFCLRMMFNSFKIPPKTADEDNNVYLGYEGDRIAYEYGLWKQAGYYKQAYLDRKCNVVKDCGNEAKYTLLHNSETYSDFCSCEEHKVNYEKYNWYKVVPFIPDTLKAFI